MLGLVNKLPVVGTVNRGLGWLVGGGTLNDGVTQAMTRNGVTLQAESRAVEAKERLMKHKISAAPVVDENGLLVGAINLQNFYQAGIL